MTTHTPFSIQNTPNGQELWHSISGNFDRLSEIMFEFVDNALSNFRKHGSDSRQVRISLTDRGSFVEISVMDSGSGIQNIHAALTLGSRASGETSLNEHGMGLKHALASLDDGTAPWTIQTRTAEDARQERYLEVQGPYGLAEAPMTGCYQDGWGDLLYPTGTLIRFRCSRKLFETLRPAGDRAQKSFQTLTEILVEELAYTYSHVLEAGELHLTVLAGENRYPVSPLFPEWDGRFCRDLPPTVEDLGGGPVEIRCQYGLIHSSGENHLYYRGNMESSGVEIRYNGRAIARGLYRRIWNGRVHNSRNHFLVVVDLTSAQNGALPPTKPTKTGFRDGDPRLEQLFSWIRANVQLPPKRKSKEKLLTEALAEKKRRESGVLLVALEEGTYRSLGLGVQMDLFVSYQDRRLAYEAKKAGSRALDVYQLKMYWDGCALDGRPITQGILIARNHCPQVANLTKKINGLSDPTGRPYDLRLTTWQAEGIDPARI